jgi:hypothetical protein
MRQPVLAELSLAARVLLAVPRRQRWRKALRLLQEVQEADTYWEQTGRCHPEFGDGSLMARCHRLSPQAEPMADDPDFLTSLIAVSRAVLRLSQR